MITHTHSLTLAPWNDRHPFVVVLTYRLKSVRQREGQCKGKGQAVSEGGVQNSRREEGGNVGERDTEQKAELCEDQWVEESSGSMKA